MTTKSQPIQPGTIAAGKAIEAQPILGQRSAEIQPYGTLVNYPIGLSDQVRAASVEALNQILSDTMYIRDIYKKHHWQVTGPTFYQLHLLMDKHFKEQITLMDRLGERIQTLGGIAIATPHDVAEKTKIERPPQGREQVPVQLSRLIEAHTVILNEAREAVRVAACNGDDGTISLLAGEVIPTNEMNVWFLSAHLVDTPLVRAK